MLDKVFIGVSSSEQVTGHTGVKHSCVLVPVLFNIYLVAVTLISVTYGTQRRRPRGGQKNRFREYLKLTLVSCNIDSSQLKNLARHRIDWRTLCLAGVANFEEERRGVVEERRRQRHLQPANSIQGMFPCHLCPGSCRSRIGLLFLLAAHRRRMELEGSYETSHRFSLSLSFFLSFSHSLPYFAPFICSRHSFYLFIKSTGLFLFYINLFFLIYLNYSLAPSVSFRFSSYAIIYLAHL
ncbi:unnamed protein product [Acanthosepion pharaonis]|uniref:Transmembrane protein n=1 Tax=Acanthosepion pharaonis TaxID=158019 RepID=A0A812C860_ACAPH|nr:unnamed protein product [Sepia pharaonis]